MEIKRGDAYFLFVRFANRERGIPRVFFCVLRFSSYPRLAFSPGRNNSLLKSDAAAWNTRWSRVLCTASTLRSIWSIRVKIRYPVFRFTFRGIVDDAHTHRQRRQKKEKKKSEANNGKIEENLNNGSHLLLIELAKRACSSLCPGVSFVYRRVKSSLTFSLTECRRLAAARCHLFYPQLRARIKLRKIYRFPAAVQLFGL